MNEEDLGLFAAALAKEMSFTKNTRPICMFSLSIEGALRHVADIWKDDGVIIKVRYGRLPKELYGSLRHDRYDQVTWILPSHMEYVLSLVVI